MGLFRRVKIALIIFCLVVIVGTFGFPALEPKVGNLLDSFFFTLITVTTVGYGDIVPLTAAGKILAITIILTGVGSAMVLLQSSFEVLVGRRIKEELNLPEKKTTKRDHHIICGYGKVGKAIIRYLEAKEQDFVIVEIDESKIDKMVEKGLSVISGDVRQEDILSRAGVQTAKSLYATMDDSTNVFVTLTAKLMNPMIRVVSKSDDMSHNMEKLKKAGADEIVACHEVGAQMMVSKGLAQKTE